MEDKETSHAQDDVNSHTQDEVNSHTQDNINSHAQEKVNSQIEDEAHTQGELNSQMQDDINSQMQDDINSQMQDEENSLSKDPYNLRFKCNLPEKVTKNYLDLCERDKLNNWPALGDFYLTELPSSDLVPALSLTKKNSLKEFYLKQNLLHSCQTTKLFNSTAEMSPLQLEFYSVISSYYDILFTNRTDENGQELRTMYSLHALNHILKAKAKIIHHNSKLSQNATETYPDQGLTRPIVLILVPFREDCYHIVKILSTFLTGCNVLGKKRFENEYGSEKRPPRKKPKPDDYEQTFSGNTDEDFKIGLKIKNRSITLYSEFYSSELIIASPLGLRQIIGAEGDKKRDFDFLSSVEILIIDRADVLMMQNWYHVDHILNHMNLLPKESHDCNFARVRTYALDGFAKFYRQTILLSSVEHTWFNAIYTNGQCCNYSGYLRTWSSVTSPAISQVVVPMPQVFRFFESESLQKEMDDRFEFFTSQVLPQFKDAVMAQTLIYIPYYFDFVRLRNFIRSEEISCTMICEYSESGKVAQARDLFFKGHRHFMLYTERAHFYHRYNIKGIQHIVFYQLPTYPHFYKEICNLLLHSNPRKKADWFAESSCTVVISKFDCLQLKHIVGMEKATHMLNSKKKVFMIKTKDT